MRNMRVNVNFFLIHKIKNQRWPLVIYLFLHVNFKVKYVLTRWNPLRALVHNRCTHLTTYLWTYLKTSPYLSHLSLQCKPHKKLHVWISHNRSSTYCMIAMQKFEAKSSNHHHHHQFLWAIDVFRVSLYKALSTLRLLSWVAFVVVGESKLQNLV